MNFEITPLELKDKLDSGADIFLLDVREDEEFEFANLGGYLIPLGQLQARVKELEPTKHIIAYCHHGVRSAHAVHFLKNLGFQSIQNLVGGIDLWSQQIDPTIRRY